MVLEQLHQQYVVPDSADDHSFAHPSARPVRTCLITRRTCPKDELLRFVVGPDRCLYPDILNKLPGRGMYVLPYRAYLEKALKQNPFSRAAKTQVKIPTDLLERIEIAYRKQMLSVLSLARRNGDLLVGADNIQNFAKTKRPALYITAARADSDNYKKHSKLFTACDMITDLNEDELAATLNITNAVHLSLKRGGHADKLRALHIRYRQVTDDPINVKEEK